MKSTLLFTSILLSLSCSTGVNKEEDSVLEVATEDQIAFEAAKTANTIEAFQYFAFTYPNSGLFPKAFLKVDSLHGVWMDSGDYPLWHCKQPSCLMILINQEGQLYVDDSVYQMQKLDDKFFNLLVSADTYLDEYSTSNGQKSSLEISKGVAFIQYDIEGFDDALRGVRQLYQALCRYRELISQEWLSMPYESLNPYQKEILDARLAGKVYCINWETAYSPPPPPPPNIDSIIRIVE
jgi:hypothetical protein